MRYDQYLKYELTEDKEVAIKSIFEVGNQKKSMFIPYEGGSKISL